MVTRKLRLFAIGIVVVLVFAIQLSQNYIIGADGYLHQSMARMMIEKRFFLSQFPQAYFSWFNNRFSDKDFLYHLYLIPFLLFFGGFWGLKIAASAATAALFGLTVYLISEARNKLAWLIAGGLFLSSQFELNTMEPRPFVGAITLTVLGVWMTTRGKNKPVFILSLIYGMWHLSGWIFPVYVFLYSMMSWIQTGKFKGSLLLSAVVGWVVSFLIHPNFPNNIFYFYLNGILVPYLAAKTGVLELGAEFFPLLTSELVKYYPFLIIFGMIIFLITFMLRSQINQKSLPWFLAAGLFLIPALTSKRNITHLYPLFLIYAAYELDGVLESLSKSGKIIRDRLLSIFIPISLVLVVYAGYNSIKGLRASLWGERVYASHYGRMAAVINNQIPPGSLIFHANWSDSQYLIGLSPNYRYFVTLDPVYMYSYNPKLFQLYRDVAFGRIKDPYQILRNIFNSDYGYVGKNYFQGLIDQIKADKRFVILDEDNLGLIFKLI